MTDKQPEVAARLLREAADELRQSHTLPHHRSDWTGEPEAKAAYDEYMAAADTVDALHAARADLVAAIERKDALLRKCLKHVASNISMTSDGTEAEDLYDAITSELSE